MWGSSYSTDLARPYYRLVCELGIEFSRTIFLCSAIIRRLLPTDFSVNSVIGSSVTSKCVVLFRFIVSFYSFVRIVIIAWYNSEALRLGSGVSFIILQ